MTKIFSDNTINSVTKFYNRYQYDDDYYYVDNDDNDSNSSRGYMYKMEPTYNTKEDARKEIASEVASNALKIGAAGLGLKWLFGNNDDD